MGDENVGLNVKSKAPPPNTCPWERLELLLDCNPELELLAVSLDEVSIELSMEESDTEVFRVPSWDLISFS